MLTSIALIFILGLFGGWLFSKMKLPSLIGMIIVGIILRRNCFDGSSRINLTYSAIWGNMCR